MRGITLLLAFIAGGLVLAGCSTAPPETTIVMTDFAFEPKQITLQPGQQGVLRRVATSDSRILRYLSHLQLMPGHILELVETAKFALADSVPRPRAGRARSVGAGHL